MFAPGRSVEPGDQQRLGRNRLFCWLRIKVCSPYKGREARPSTLFVWATCGCFTNGHSVRELVGRGFVDITNVQLQRKHFGRREDSFPSTGSHPFRHLRIGPQAEFLPKAKKPKQPRFSAMGLGYPYDITFASSKTTVKSLICGAQAQSTRES
jgi:hypothetical protein